MDPEPRKPALPEKGVRSGSSLRAPSRCPAPPWWATRRGRA